MLLDLPLVQSWKHRTQQERGECQLPPHAVLSAHGHSPAPNRWQWLGGQLGHSTAQPAPSQLFPTRSNPRTKYLLAGVAKTCTSCKAPPCQETPLFKPKRHQSSHCVHANSRGDYHRLTKVKVQYIYGCTLHVPGHRRGDFLYLPI